MRNDRYFIERTGKADPCHFFAASKKSFPESSVKVPSMHNFKTRSPIRSPTPIPTIIIVRFFMRNSLELKITTLAIFSPIQSPERYCRVTTSLGRYRFFPQKSEIYSSLSKENGKQYADFSPLPPYKQGNYHRQTTYILVYDQRQK